MMTIVSNSLKIKEFAIESYVKGAFIPNITGLRIRKSLNAPTVIFEPVSKVVQ